VAVSDNNARPLVARLRILEEGPVNMRGGMSGARWLALEGGVLKLWGVVGVVGGKGLGCSLPWRVLMRVSWVGLVHFW